MQDGSIHVPRSEHYHRCRLKCSGICAYWRRLAIRIRSELIKFPRCSRSGLTLGRRCQVQPYSLPARPTPWARLAFMPTLPSLLLTRDEWRAAVRRPRV